MPTYDYACAACGHRFEVVHGVHGQGPDTCPNCGSGPVRKAFAPPTIMFKGSGWAKMDRRSSAHSGSGSKKGTEDSSGSSTKGGGDGAASGGDTAAAKGSTGSDSTSSPSGSSASSSAPSTSAPD